MVLTTNSSLKRDTRDRGGVRKGEGIKGKEKKGERESHGADRGKNIFIT